jgi:hypothetical protein
MSKVREYLTRSWSLDGCTIDNVLVCATPLLSRAQIPAFR